MAGTVRKLSFAEGVVVTAPTDLRISSSVMKAFVDDAAYVTSEGAAVDGSAYVNTTSDTIKFYSGATWISALTSALADGQIILGSGAGVATALTPTGDVTISNTGVTAIGATKVTNAMLAGSITLAKLAAVTAFTILGAAVDGVLSARGIDGDLYVPVWNAGLVTIRLVPGIIDNADVNASAGILGTKIAPDFGSQAITTTGTAGFGDTLITGEINVVDRIGAGPQAVSTASKLDIRDTNTTPVSDATGLAYFLSNQPDYVAVFENINGTTAGNGIWVDTKWNSATNYIIRLSSDNGASRDELFSVRGSGTAALLGSLTAGSLITTGTLAAGATTITGNVTVGTTATSGVFTGKNIGIGDSNPGFVLDHTGTSPKKYAIGAIAAGMAFRDESAGSYRYLLSPTGDHHFYAGNLTGTGNYAITGTLAAGATTVEGNLNTTKGGLFIKNGSSTSLIVQHFRTLATGSGGSVLNLDLLTVDANSSSGSAVTIHIRATCNKTATTNKGGLYDMVAFAANSGGTATFTANSTVVVSSIGTPGSPAVSWVSISGTTATLRYTINETFQAHALVITISDRVGDDVTWLV